MPHTPAQAATPIDPQRVVRPWSHLGDHDEAVVRWQAHLDARRIGNVPAAASEVVARREATAAQFAAYARYARRAHNSWRCDLL